MAKAGMVINKKRWERMKKNLLTGSRKSAQVGWFIGQHHAGSDLPMAQIASWLEYGHRNGGIFEGTITPPRPFMRAGFIVYLRDNPEIAAITAAQIRHVMEGKKTWTAAYSTIATKMAEALKMIMESWNDPRNSPMTVALKGFDNPLIETGELVNNIKWKVRNRRTK